MESWGRKRRSAEKVEKNEEDMTLSQEILVLDFGDEDTKFSHRQTASLPVIQSMKKQLPYSTAPAQQKHLSWRWPSPVLFFY